jgi:hypothetical protein
MDGWGRNAPTCFIHQRNTSLMDFLIEGMNRRIDLAYNARQSAKSQWGKLYWDNVLAYLLREANRLN